MQSNGRHTLVTFNVLPQLPSALANLHKLAFNLRWCWDHNTIDLFRRLDRNLWDETGRNPVRLLGQISQAKLNDAASDEGYLLFYERTVESLQSYLRQQSWYDKRYGKTEKPLFAYFSAEFGITESLPIYSGGLGILAGDHLKSASDMGVPIVGVGLLYQQGYFKQYLNPDGWQQETYPNNDFYQLPLTPLYEENDSKRWLKVELDFPGRKVYARIIKVDIGKVSLYLLDTNIPENSDEDRRITDQLYGGDNEMRIKQEIVLGMGGLRALTKLGINPEVCHMNEGHSGFLAIEKMLMYRRQGFTFEESKEAVRYSCVFTTHTPVAAGIDQFPEELIDRYFSHLYDQLGISRQEFLSLGRCSGSQSGPFNMAYFCLNMSSRANGVSRLHGEVSRKMFHINWPEIPVSEVPIGYVTNGVHAPTWISRDMRELFDRYLGSDWLTKQTDRETWTAVNDIPDEELWRTHERRRERLVAYTRRRVRMQMENRGATKSEIETARELLDGSTLTIGFARRFATYKRGDLILHDVNRLKKIILNKEKPVQFIFAGKAHPRDVEGKEIIKRINHFIRDEEIRRRFVFIEDYDMGVARYLVQGVDVWLNNPRRPHEASGTSGMKVIFNGGLNLSILDGWWYEAYHPETGWAIGKAEDYDDFQYQDYVESSALYDVLEKEIIPLFYQRTYDGLPRGWIQKMKNSMMQLGERFNTNRMVKQYVEEYYQPTHELITSLSANNWKRLKELTEWKAKVRKAWNGVSILEFYTSNVSNLTVSSVVTVSAKIHTNGLKPQDIASEVFFGSIDTNGKLLQGEAHRMNLEKKIEENIYLYKIDLVCKESGRHGIAVRVRPDHSSMPHRHDTGLIRWATKPS
ncbi:MAG: alpha-glucan family phosphorylase [bacterium]|nr:alpha-glucan family phosphorylase [bacterium]